MHKKIENKNWINENCVMHGIAASLPSRFSFRLKKRNKRKCGDKAICNKFHNNNVYLNIMCCFM